MAEPTTILGLDLVTTLTILIVLVIIAFIEFATHGWISDLFLSRRGNEDAPPRGIPWWLKTADGFEVEIGRKGFFTYNNVGFVHLRGWSQPVRGYKIGVNVFEEKGARSGRGYFYSNRGLDNRDYVFRDPRLQHWFENKKTEVEYIDKMYVQAKSQEADEKASYRSEAAKSQEAFDKMYVEGKIKPKEKTKTKKEQKKEEREEREEERQGDISG